MIWRNDDVSYKTKLDEFKFCQELFNKYNVIHTIALMCKDIDKNPELIKYINDNNVSVQIHCWGLEHTDFPENNSLKKDLQRCILTIKNNFNKFPEYIYPPHNRIEQPQRDIIHSLFLKVSTRKISLQQYIGGNRNESVINFHSWHESDRNLLETALKIYSDERKDNN